MIEILMDTQIKLHMPGKENDYSNFFMLIRVDFNYDKTKLINLDERLALYKKQTNFLRNEALTAGADVIYDFYQDIAFEWKNTSITDLTVRFFDFSHKIRKSKSVSASNEILFHPYLTASMIEIDPGYFEKPYYMQQMISSLQIIHQYCNIRNHNFLTTSDSLSQLKNTDDFNLEHITDIKLPGHPDKTAVIAIYELGQHPISLS